MTIRAKFRVTSHKKHYYNNSSTTITLEPIYDTSIPEDKRFCDATPSGHFEMLVNNPNAVEALKLGSYFYIDMTEVPAEQPK